MSIFLKRILPLLFVIFLIREIAHGSSNGIIGYSSSPVDGANCTNCHNSYGVNSGPGSVTITTNIPGTGYVLGQTYNVSVVVAQTSIPLFGLDFQALTAANANAGTLTITDATSTQKATSGGITTITHKSNGGLSSNSKSFNFTWTAPASNAGNVTFYTSGLASNNNGRTNSDYVYTKTAVFSAASGATITTGIISGSPFCAGQTGISIPYTITGAYNAGNVFTAELSSSTGSFTTPTTLGSVTSTTAGTITTTVPLPATAGTQYRIRVVSSSPAITGADNGTNLTINLNPTTANAGADQTICGTTATLAGNIATVGTGAWTLASGAGTITAPSSPTSGITALGVGQNKFVWTISNGSCISRDTVAISGTAAPTTANAGVDQTACSNTATLAGNTPTVGTGVWTLASGAGTITTPSSPTSGITALGVGQNKFVWTISNAPCSASTDTVVITQSGSITVSNAGADQTICGSTATLAGNTPTVGTGTWTLVSGAGTITTPSSPTSGITALGVGQNKFVWTIANPPCSPSIDTVIITRAATPTTANAGVDQTVCGTSASLAGNTPTVGTGIWTLAGGSGTITTPSSPTTGVTGLGVGQNKFVWTISNSPCSSSSDTVIITQSGSITTANAGTDQTVCGTSTTLAGNTPVSGTGIWTVAVGGATITNASSPTSAVTGLSYGQNKLIWTISNGACTPSRDTVIISASATPTIANAGADQTVCGTTATLSANTATSGAGTWSVVSGSATITSPGSPSSTVSGLGVGQNKLVWTISNAPCTASKDTVIITHNVCAPTIITASSVNIGPYCASTTYTLAVEYTTTGSLTGPFLVQLSDSTGSFSNPLTIGYGSNSPISVTLPSGLPRGSHYRVRVVSNNDGITGSDNGSDISINTCALTALVNNANARLQLFPNPNNGQFVIVPERSGEATISIIGVLGNELYCETAVLQKGQGLEILATQLERGVYVLKVSFEDDAYIGAFIKE